MTITYALLSPTYGMHLYTAHLANRAREELGQRIQVVTTRNAPTNCYDPAIPRLAPVTTMGTGFAREGLDRAAYRAALAAIVEAAREGVVHFTGVHLWNVPLAHALRRRGIPVAHTLHDLTPHSGVRRGALIRLWNRLLIAAGPTLLVHGERYRQELMRAGVPADRVRFAPLIHGFWGHAAESAAKALETRRAEGDAATSAAPLALFFGRIERYKGVDTLLEAWRMLAAGDSGSSALLVIAGRLAPGLALPPLPPGVEVRDRRIDDAEAFDLFGRAALLVLPYRDATQSALVAAAARFGVPCVATQTGALPEYVQHGVTGWLVPPADPAALADTLRAALADKTRLFVMGNAAREWYQAARGQELGALTDLYGAASMKMTEQTTGPAMTRIGGGISDVEHGVGG